MGVGRGGSFGPQAREPFPKEGKLEARVPVYSPPPLEIEADTSQQEFTELRPYALT